MKTRKKFAVISFFFLFFGKSAGKYFKGDFPFHLT